MPADAESGRRLRRVRRFYRFSVCCAVLIWVCADRFVVATVLEGDGALRMVPGSLLLTCLGAHVLASSRAQLHDCQRGAC